MKTHRLFLISIVALVLGLASSATWTPNTMVHAAEEACAASTLTLPGEDLPDGVVREQVLAIPAPAEDGSDSDINAVSSVVCIAPGTTITLDKFPPGSGTTTEMGQPYPVTIVVLDGEYEIRLVRACAPTAIGGTCAGTDGVASFYTSDDPAAERPLTENWRTLRSGDVVVLSDVTIEVRTPADRHARLLTSGIYIDVGAGAGCPSRCFQHP